MLHDPLENFRRTFFSVHLFRRFARKSEKRRRYLTSSTRTLGLFSRSIQLVFRTKKKSRGSNSICSRSPDAARHGVARSNDSDRSPRKETAHRCSRFSFHVFRCFSFLFQSLDPSTVVPSNICISICADR